LAINRRNKPGIQKFLTNAAMETSDEAFNGRIIKLLSILGEAILGNNHMFGSEVQN